MWATACSATGVQLGKFKSFLEDFNPSSLCRNNQDFLFGDKEFSQYTFNDVFQSPYVNIDGNCVACDTIASSLVSQRGNTGLYLIDSVPPRHFSVVTRGIGLSMQQGGINHQQEIIIDYARAVFHESGKNILTPDINNKLDESFRLKSSLSYK